MRLHDALDAVEGAEAPPEWIVSRVCEAFSCVPSVALRELEADPRLVLDILELRGYAEAKHAVEAATSRETHPDMDHPMVQAVYDIIGERLRRRS